MAFMGRRRKFILLLSLLFLVVLSLNTEFLWKMMYPIKYEEEVKEYSNKYEVDPYMLLAVIRVESNFDPSQQSRRGAIGLMQIMPDTAKWIVDHKNDSKEILDQLHIPNINMDMGAWFLKALHKEFKGNWVATLAAYNGGPGNVNKWMKEGWEPGPDTINQIPFGETRHYVQRVLYYAKKYKWIYESDFAS
jgi:soluble lytic murein transglycosylase